MDAVTLLRLQLQNAHQTLEGTLGDIGHEPAHREPGGRAFKVAANYAHVVFSEDAIINGMFRQAAPLFVSSWAGRTGFSAPMPDPTAGANWPETHNAWARTVTADFPKAREYARAVQADAEAYVSSLTPDDLDRPFTPPWPGVPDMPLALAITVLVIGHYFSLAGEMSAGKGVLGLQGYPF